MSNNDDESIGFKDFIEIKNTPGLRGNQKQYSGNYDLFTFLERESVRLEKLLELCEEKSHMLKHYPQDTHLIVEQEAKNIQVRFDVVESLIKKDSPLSLNLKLMLASHFGNHRNAKKPKT